MTADAPRAGRTRPTLRDVARRADVSVATASRVLTSDYPVADSTRSRVMDAVQELDYVVTNRSARSTPKTKPGLIAMVVADVVSPLVNLVATGVSESAGAAGRLSVIHTTDGSLDREAQAVDLLCDLDSAEAVIMLGGVVDSPAYQKRMAGYARKLHSNGVQLVLCGRPQLTTEAPALVVEYDNVGGAYAVVSYLLSMGHRRVAALSGTLASSTYIARIAGYRRAHADFGLPVDENLIIECAGGNRSAGYQGTGRVLDELPDVSAIFAFNDVMASGALARLREAGLRVPDDFSLAGYDNIPIAQELHPPLTTVYMPHQELGRAAVRLALQRPRPGSGDEHQLLGTHLVIRESTGPVNPARRITPS